MKKRHLLLISMILALCLVFALAGTALADESFYLTDLPDGVIVEEEESIPIQDTLQIKTVLSGKIIVDDIDFSGPGGSYQYVYNDVFSTVLDSNGEPLKNKFGSYFGAYAPLAIDMDSLFDNIEFGDDITIVQKNLLLKDLFNPPADATIVVDTKTKQYTKAALTGDYLGIMLGNNSVQNLGDAWVSIDFYDGDDTNAPLLATMTIDYSAVEFVYADPLAHVFGNIKTRSLDMQDSGFSFIGVEFYGVVNVYDDYIKISDIGDHHSYSNFADILDADGYPLDSVMDGLFTIASLDLAELGKYFPEDADNVTILQYNPALSQAYPGEFADDMKIKHYAGAVADMQAGGWLDFIVSGQDAGHAILFIFAFDLDTDAPVDFDVFDEGDGVVNIADIGTIITHPYSDEDIYYLPVMIFNDVEIVDIADLGNAINFSEKQEPETPSKPIDNYVDAVNHWAKDAINWTLEKGYMNGISNNFFSPDGPTTRAMAMTILHRLAGLPAAASAGFVDVPVDAYYYNAVNWGVANNITKGVGNNAFDPNSNVTREQVAVFLFSYAKMVGLDTSNVDLNQLNKFSDYADTHAWAVEAMNWAIGVQLFEGYQDNTIQPTKEITRAEFAVLLQRFDTLLAAK